MWPRRELCDLLGVEHPIIQAPMAGSATPQLAAAVSNAGGLGSLGCGEMAVEAVGDRPRGAGAYGPDRAGASDQHRQTLASSSVRARAAQCSIAMSLNASRACVRCSSARARSLVRR